MLPQVDSAINVLNHVRRKHSRAGYVMPPPEMLAHVARGMRKHMLINYGKHSVLPSRAEPFTADQNRRMLILAGKVVGGRKYAASAPFWRGWRVVNCFADQAGERKGGIIGHENGEYNRSDVFWVMGKAAPDPDPSPELLARFGTCDGHYVIVRGGPSKADRDGRYFATAPMSFKYNKDNKSSFAAAITDYELAYPLRGVARNTAPLFAQDGASKRWTASAVDRTLDNVMSATLSSAERVHKTFHSKRVWLASAFKFQRREDGEIQGLLRWRSPESIRLYGRMDELYQADVRDSASTVTFKVMNATSLPTIDPIVYSDKQEIMAPDFTKIASSVDRIGEGPDDVAKG